MNSEIPAAPIALSSLHEHPASGEKISVVVPVYNSQNTLTPLVERILELENTTGMKIEIILVNDCSQDESWKVLKKLKERFPKHLKIINLLRNAGQHNALLCGFHYVSGQVIVTIDDDLQNPPEEIPKLVAPIFSGTEVAIGSYARKEHSSFRNFCGGLVDNIQRYLFRLPKDFQLTSFRAISADVVRRVSSMGGAYPYVTSMILFCSRERVNVEVEHLPRSFGSSTYSLRRSLSLSLNLILSYSAIPLMAIMSLCAFSFLFSFGFASFVIIRALVQDIAIKGWASIVVLISFFSGLTLFSLLIFGFYISRMYKRIMGEQGVFSVKEVHE